MRRKPITAAELLEALEHDPEYQARRADKEAALRQRAAEYAEDERVLVGECRRVGCQIESVWDFVNNAPHPFLPRPFVGPYEHAYPILVRKHD